MNTVFTHSLLFHFSEMEQIFPTLTNLPAQIASHLQSMISCLENLDLSAPLPQYLSHEHIFEIRDSTNRLRCLFKRFRDDDEEAARKEVAVYLLDHPPNSHRSLSETVYGFAGVRPTVFVRFRCNSEVVMGILVEFVDEAYVIDQDYYHWPISTDDIQSIVLLDIRFGNMDRNRENILLKEDEGVAHLIPIDHECSFANEVQAYNCAGFAWLKSKDFGDYGVAFSPDCVTYVSQLDPGADLEFLRHCGWEVEPYYVEQLTIFTMFLKKAVSKGLTAFHIGKIASFWCDDERHNLQAIVDSVVEEGNYIENVGIRMEERLTEYVMLNMP